LILYTVGRPLGLWIITLHEASAYTQDKTDTEYAQTSMPAGRFEPTSQCLRGAKIVHALDRSATVIGVRNYYPSLC
jgi:hypothetical protein